MDKILNKFGRYRMDMGEVNWLKTWMLCLLTGVVSITSFGQGELDEYVEWEFDVNIIDDCSAELVLKANIQKGWHINSQNISEPLIPTSFDFDSTGAFTLLGELEEGKGTTKFDSIWGFEITYFSGNPIWKQKIELNNKEAFSVKGTLEYQPCNEVQCLAPNDIPFEIKIPKREHVCVKE